MEKTSENYCTPPKTPEFIKSLFDEDSGLGMDFNDVDDSPSFRFCIDSNKRKRPDTSDTPVSYSKKRTIRCRQRNVLKKSLSFDVQTQSTNEHLLDKKQDSSDSHVSSDDVLVQGFVLTGDGSKQCCLPTVQGRFHDLRYITPATVSDVLNGKYDDTINSFRIIDSRYTYEFDGGHVKGAENIHNRDDILQLLEKPQSTGNDKRDIIIFHCEFSSERGPKMCRHLRNHDREINAENYPALNYPEIYVLKGGYKEFYEHHKSLCTPMSYVPMLSKDHKDDLRHFRTKSKSWHAGQKRGKLSARLF